MPLPSRQRHSLWITGSILYRTGTAHLHFLGCIVATLILKKSQNWERARLREPAQDLPPLETIDMVRAEVETAEAELARQSMRRREMESEMNALKKRHARDGDGGGNGRYHGGRRR